MEKEAKDTRHAFWIPAGLVLLAMALVALGTHWSVGITPDSVTYLTNAISGAGVHAPLYAWLLAAFDGIGIPKVDAARWLNVVLLGATVLLVWFALFRAFGSQVTAVLGAALVLTSPKILQTHEAALSDPLFLFLTLASLVVLARHLDTGGRRLLLLSAALAAAAFFTRYAGAPLVLAGVLALLSPGRANAVRRMQDAAIYAGVAGGPMLLFLMYSRAVKGVATGREMALLGEDNLARIYDGLQSLSLYLLPNQVPGLIRFGLLLALAVAAAAMLARYPGKADGRRSAERPAAFSTLPWVLAVFVVCYAAFLVGTILIQPHLQIRVRYLAPIYVSCVLLVMMLVHVSVVRQRPGWHGASLLFVVLAVGLTMMNSVRAAKWVTERFHDGVGYASRAWQTSELVTRVKRLPPEIPIYSNGNDALAFLTGRDVRSIPRKFDPVLGKPDPSFHADIESMKTDLLERDGVLVYFDTVTWRWYLPPASDLAQELSLHVKETAADGVIYQAAR